MCEYLLLGLGIVFFTMIYIVSFGMNLGSLEQGLYKDLTGKRSKTANDISEFRLMIVYGIFFVPVFNTVMWLLISYFSIFHQINVLWWVIGNDVISTKGRWQH